MLIDTHCHIHEADYPLDVELVLARALENNVGEMICVGTSIDSSTRAVAFAKEYSQAHATIGIHPHEVKDGWEELSQIITTGKTVAVGEIGLDYFYTHSSRDIQIKALEWQIDLALKNNLPIIFHVRDASSAERRGSAFSDFWSIMDNFKGIRGELHSFTDDQQNLEKGLERGLYVGVNGISTFTRDKKQQELFTSIPLESLLLETDAPFLTPIPLRGKPNEPAYVKYVAEHQAVQRGISLEKVMNATTENARTLFSL